MEVKGQSVKVHALKSDDVALVSIDLKKINQSKQPKYKKYMNEGCIIKKNQLRVIV